MSNLGIHTDNNHEYGDQFWRIAGRAGKLAAITCIMNPNDLSKASPAINAAVNQALRFHNVETNMSGTDQGRHTAQQNVTTAINAIKPALALYPNARWAYFRNEIGDWSRADFYAEEMKLWIEGLAALGYYGGICCWSFGTPSYELWPKFDTALAAANANGGAVLLHEYGVLTMKSAYDAAKGMGHHCLRYRNIWAQNNYPKRFPKLMWWVTETGLDKDVNAGIGGGWRDSGVTADQYLADLYWYDSEISKDGVSATVYQWGTESKWQPYDIQGPVVDNLLAHIGEGVPHLKAGGTTQTPPVDPQPEPEPEPVPVELIVNGDFTGGVTPVPGNPNQQQMPTGWKMRDPRDRVEIEMDPHYRPPTARIIEAYEKREVAIQPFDDITVEVGATYRVTMVAAPWCTTDPSDPNNPPGSPSDSPAEIRLRVNGTLVGSLPVVPGVLPDQFMTITADVKATVDKWTIGCGIKPEFAVARTDLRIDRVSVVKIKDAEPTTPPPAFPAWYIVKTGGTDRLRKRLAPMDGEIVELQVNGSELLIESITNGWAKEVGVGLYASAQYLVKK